MARRSTPAPEQIEQKIFRSTDEIGRGIVKLKKRLAELDALDLAACVNQHTKADVNFIDDLKNTVLEIFGPNSPEYARVPSYFYLPTRVVKAAPADHVRGRENARVGHRTMIAGLIKRLEEKREDLQEGVAPAPALYFDKLNLHPRIADVARERFLDGYHWDAVFAASKALVNYVKEKSGSELDGAKLMHSVFSKNCPVLAFNTGADQTDLDEQEGMMHLFVGAVLAIRNPGGHAFPEGSEQRAVEYISLLSTLAYRVQEAKRNRTT